MVNLSSFISIPLFCQVTLTKTKKVLDPSTVSSTRELKDNRKKNASNVLFLSFSSNITLLLKLYTENRGENKLKKTCNERTARTKSTLPLFQHKRKANFNTRNSKHWEGWPFAGKNGQTSEQICCSKGALQTNTSLASPLSQDTFSYEHTINL